MLNGDFALHTLERWPRASEYVLVDLWQAQDNYLDMNNWDHDTHYQTAMQKLQPFRHKLNICRNLTTVCAERFDDLHFDYVYVDARHDYKGVSLDLEAWWPKIAHGGFLAGHDYVAQVRGTFPHAMSASDQWRPQCASQDEGPAETGQNWTLNFDGTVDPLGRAVKGAVDDFAARRRRQIVVMYREGGWNSWIMRK